MILDWMDIEKEPILLVRDGYNAFKEDKNLDFMGIYACFSINTGKVYIGSSYSLRRRINDHERTIKNDSHYNNLIKSEFQKNEFSFIWYLLEEVQNEEALKITEQSYLDTLEPFPWTGRGFNLSKSAYCSGWLGKKFSEEQKETAAIKRRGDKPPFKIRSPEGEIHEFTCSPRQFAIKNNLNDCKLTSVLRGGRNHHLGWHLPENPLPIWEIKSPRGEIFKFWNVKQFVEQNDLCETGLGKVLKGIYLEYKGWTLPETEMSENQFSIGSPDGNIFHFTSIIDFCKDKEIDYRSIYKVISGEKKGYKGWFHIEDAPIRKRWRVTSPSGELVTFLDVEKFSKENNLDPNKVNMLVKYKIKDLNGWRAGDKRGKRFFTLISPSREEFTFDNVDKFAKANDLNTMGVHRVIKGKTKAYKGWTLKPKTESN